MGKIFTKKSKKHYINVGISLSILLIFQFLPAPAPITHCGMMVLGCLFSFLYLIATDDCNWPIFLIIWFLAFYTTDIFPGSGSSGMDISVLKSFGNSSVLFIICTLLLCNILEESGLLRRIAVWFISRKFAKKGAWSFTLMLIAATLVIASFMDPVPAAVVMISVAKEIFQTLGFKKGDSWPMMVICMIPWASVLGFAATPIGHNLPIAIMGMVEQMSGARVNIVNYMIVGIPIVLVVWILMFLYFRFVVKPDLSMFDNIDYSALDSLKVGKMDTKEKLAAVAGLFTLILWVFPGLITFSAPDSKAAKLFGNVHILFPLLISLVVLAIIHIDGEKMFDFEVSSKKISWSAVYLLAGNLLMAAAIGSDTTGIPQWLTANIGPIMGKFSPMMLILLVVFLCVSLTNLLNNWSVAVVMTTVAVPIVIEKGVNPAILGVLIPLCCNCAFPTPAATPVTAFSVSDPYCNPQYVLKHGISMAIITLIVALILGYPLASIAF